MFKKITISFLLAIFLLVSIITPYAKAQENTSLWYNPGPREWLLKTYDTSNPSEIYGERYTNAQVNWIIWSVFWFPFTHTIGPKILVCALSGDVSECVEAITQSVKNLISTTPVKENDKGLLASVFEERSLSGVTYFKDKARKLKLIPEAEAQEGFGFQKALLPIQSMWRVSRNIAYTLFVLIVVILAFMIMFRVKISPQVVISVQSVIPKVIVAIILVTFSYAIAGFLVDLMYVFIGIISLLGKGFLPWDNVSSSAVYNFLTKGQPFNIELQIGVIGLFILYLILFLVIFTLVFISTFGALQTVGLAAILGAITVSTAGIAGVIATTLAGAIGVIAIIVALWMLIKILWSLTKAYASILLLTIFAPFQILLGTLIPSLGFGSWLKSFISNLAVFVITGTMFLLSFSFLLQSLWLAFGEGFGKEVIDLLFGSATVEGTLSILKTGSGGASWPPLLGIGESSVPLLMLGASFVIFTMIPSTANLIQSIMQGKPFSYGAAIGETITTPAKMGLGTMGERTYTKIETKAGPTSVTARTARTVLNALQKRL